MQRGGFPALHHNSCACASCSPAVIEKEIAQLKKGVVFFFFFFPWRVGGGGGGVQSGPQILSARAV